MKQNNEITTDVIQNNDTYILCDNRQPVFFIDRKEFQLETYKDCFKLGPEHKNICIYYFVDWSNKDKYSYMPNYIIWPLLYPHIDGFLEIRASVVLAGERDRETGYPAGLTPEQISYIKEMLTVQELAKVVKPGLYGMYGEPIYHFPADCKEITQEMIHENVEYLDRDRTFFIVLPGDLERIGKASFIFFRNLKHIFIRYNYNKHFFGVEHPLEIGDFAFRATGLTDICYDLNQPLHMGSQILSYSKGINENRYIRFNFWKGKTLPLEK